MPAAPDLVRNLSGDGAYRITPRSGDVIEEALAEADRRGRAASVARLRRILGGFDLGHVDTVADSATMALLHVDRDFVESLAVGELLDRDVVTADLPIPRLRLANGTLPPPLAEDVGVVLPPTQPGDPHAVEPFAAWRSLVNGTTIILNNVGSRIVGPLLGFTNDLGRATATRPQVNAYLSERGAPGFGRHWDDHDVLIIQCSGRKHWEVFEPAALSPVVGYVDRHQFGRSAFSAVLEPGMGLFIPRGWGHQVRGFTDELSSHLTFGMRRMSGLDLIRGLVEGDPARGDRAVLDDGFVDDRGYGSLASDAAAVETVYARWRARSRAHRDVGPIALWSAVDDRFDGWRIEAPAMGGMVFVDGDDVAPTEVGIAASGSTFALGRDWASAYAELVGGASLTIEEIQALVPGSDIDACAQWVVHLGLLGVALVTREDVDLP